MSLIKRCLDFMPWVFSEVTQSDLYLEISLSSHVEDNKGEHEETLALLQSGG